MLVWFGLAASDITVKVSRSTLSELEWLREEFNSKSIDETLQVLIKERQRKTLTTVFGSNKGRAVRFSEVDRGEDR